MDNQEILSAEAGHRSVSGGLSVHICDVHGYIEDTKNYQVYAVVVPGLVNGDKVTWG